MPPASPSSAAETLIAGVPVRLAGVRQVFPGGVEAIRRIDLDIAAGEFVSILGPSGCGKSTLLRLIAGLDTPSEGTVSVGAPETFDRRTDVAYVFQDAHLLPWRTVLQNAGLPLELQGQDSALTREKANSALSLVGLSEFADRYPGQLSGGMRMRVSLARALVTKPKLLLMDEPFAALDEITRQRLDEMLRELWLKSGMTLLFVTHSTQEATFLSNRAVVLSKRPGRVMLDRQIDLSAERTSTLRGEARFASEMHAIYEALEAGERGELAPGGGDMSEQPRNNPLASLWPPLVPLLVGGIALELIVRAGWVPPYLVPAPVKVATALVNNWERFSSAALYTAGAATAGFVLSAVVGVALAVVMASSRWVQRMFYPYAIFFQTVPIVAIAPLLVVYVGYGVPTVVAASFIVSVFPVLANALAGLLSTDPALRDLFRLYGASPTATLFKLRLPAALPNILTGLKVAAGLAVIGAIVGEFVGGSGGLGDTLDALKTSQRTDKVFALLLLAAGVGLALFGLVSLLSWWLLRHWHASEK